MRKFILFLFSILLLSCQKNEENTKTDPVDYVNILMGTQSKFSLSSGNTYPAIAMPWAMNFWTPQTGKMGDGWIYSYTDDISPIFVYRYSVSYHI